jgi:hypothetical protein
MPNVMRDRMPTIPEDLSEYARIHTGPGSWSETNFERSNVRADFPTPRPPYVQLSVKDLVPSGDETASRTAAP